MALDVASRTYVISSGRIVYEGVPSELAANETVKMLHLGVAEGK
jgi:ABC-type lipopolysaccharide export system ATPase subunit